MPGTDPQSMDAKWDDVADNASEIHFSSASHKPATAWAAQTAMLLDKYVVPTVSNGHYYRCSTAGTTGASEPAWPTDGSTVTDGSVVWQDMGVLIVPGGPIVGSFGKNTIVAGDGNGAWAIADGTGVGDRTLTLATGEITLDPAGGTVRAIIAYDPINARVKHFWDATEKQLNGGQVYTYPELDANDAAPVNI